MIFRNIKKQMNKNTLFASREKTVILVEIHRNIFADFEALQDQS